MKLLGLIFPDFLINEQGLEISYIKGGGSERRLKKKKGCSFVRLIEHHGFENF